MTSTVREALLLMLAIRRAFELNIPTADLLEMLRHGTALAQKALDEHEAEGKGAG